MDLLHEYTTIVNALEEKGIDYATCGGLAMAVHGFVRATKDIDILICRDDLDAAFAVARKFGYDIEGLPLDFDGGMMQLRRLSKIDRESKSLITVDFLLVTEKTKTVWNTPRTRNMGIRKRLGRIERRPHRNEDPRWTRSGSGRYPTFTGGER